jgi:hypothetical protein
MLNLKRSTQIIPELSACRGRRSAAGGLPQIGKPNIYFKAQKRDYSTDLLNGQGLDNGSA